GGGLRTAVEVADQFLDEGIILTEEFGDGRTNVFRSEADGLAQEIPLVVLIDEGSASASELLAGAIQDRGRGILIGQTSFGKGTVQAWPHLSNGGGLRLTIAHWLTPDDHWIHQAGIEPDFLVAVDGENLDDDTQLQAAVDFLLGRPVIKK
ncbi:MAG: S41 family peptidase, partial [Anaerolineae bacterium]